jgi:outer membrane protein assembly factor BamB
MRALDKMTGRLLWSFKTTGVILASPIIVGDYLLFASLDRNLYCLDKKTGTLNSSFKTDHEIRFPAVSDGQSIYIATHSGNIFCLGD